MRYVIIAATLFLSASAGYAVPGVSYILLVPLHSYGSTWERGGATPPTGHEAVLCRDLHELHISWYRTWWYGNGNLCPDIEYVPDIWSGAILTPTPRLSPSAWLLTFNEPNLKQQANMTPEEAAALWPLIEQVAGNRRILSPSVYAGSEWRGGNWLERFLALCADCRIDGMDLHWYGYGECDDPRMVSLLEAYLSERAAQFPDKPLWLSEWGCHGEGVREFVRLALPVVEHYTERNALWAVYTESPDEPLISDGALTPLGAVYAGEDYDRP